MKRLLLILFVAILAVSLASCGGATDHASRGASAAPTHARPAPSPAPPAPTPTAFVTTIPSPTPTVSEPAAEGQNWAPVIKKFEAENGIATMADWYNSITKVDVVLDSSLWVYTTLPADAEAAALAERVCGAYSIFTQEHPAITSVYVRAQDGQQLAKCGPDA